MTLKPAPLLLPVLLLTVLDYLLTSHLGDDATLDLVRSIEQGSFTLVTPSLAELQRCRELMAQYRDLHIGLADVSVVATAELLRLPRRLTLDQRHFRAIQPKGLDYFIILPADHS